MPKLIDKLYDEQAASMANLIERHHKPLIGFTFQSADNPFIQKLLNYGVAVLPSPERAARAMAALAGYSGIVSRFSTPASP
jgi:acetyl-CoA synthetase (ADP-forming)